MKKILIIIVFLIFQSSFAQELTIDFELSPSADVNGSLTDIKVLKHLGHGTGEEAIRVLKLSPKWTPGIKNGIPVKCFYTLPINVSALND